MLVTIISIKEFMSKLVNARSHTGKLAITMPQELVDKMKKSMKSVSKYITM